MVRSCSICMFGLLLTPKPDPMSPAPDVRTVTLVCGVVHLCVAWVLTSVWLRRKTYPGFGAWALSGWCSFAGILLIFYRGRIPEFFTVILANLCLMGTALAIQWGLTIFSGSRPSRVRYGLFLAILGILLMVFTFAHPSLQGRLIAISLAVSFVGFRSAHLCWKRLRLGSVNPLVVSTLFFVGVFYLLRAVLTCLVPPPSNNYMVPSMAQAIALLVYLGAHTILAISLLVLNSQRLEEELQKSLDECRMLRGIIPICAYCKKIRDDEGAWGQVENYIRKHPDASFSHGICPECAQRELHDFQETTARWNTEA